MTPAHWISALLYNTRYYKQRSLEHWPRFQLFTQYSECLMNASHPVHISPLNTELIGCINSQCSFPPKFHQCTNLAIHQQLPTCIDTPGAFPAQYWSLPLHDLSHRIPNYHVCHTFVAVQPLTHPQQISHTHNSRSSPSKHSAGLWMAVVCTDVRSTCESNALANALGSRECTGMQIAHSTLAICLIWSLHHRCAAVQVSVTLLM